jgi:hypothetical protein
VRACGVCGAGRSCFWRGARQHSSRRTQSAAPAPPPPPPPPHTHTCSHHTTTHTHRLKGKGGSSSSSSAASAEEARWRKWVDERFVKVLTANIYRTWE